jgi:peptidoglycan hydrolase-like protein with peptidoglycan-binding domain
VVATALLAAAVVAAGCSSSSSSSTTTTSSASTTTTTNGGLSVTAAKSLQRALFAVGCYSGAVDGAVGPTTIRAIRSFQSADGLTVDGVYGANTRAKLVAAVAAGTKICTTATTTTTTTGGTTTTTASGTSVPAAATAAINAYEATNGPKAGTWVITSSALSKVDPTYVLFRIGPASSTQVDVQPGYGIVHLSGGTWTVIGFGSAEVGCPGTGSSPVVPAAVLTGFGLTCPTTS